MTHALRISPRYELDDRCQAGVIAPLANIAIQLASVQKFQAGELAFQVIKPEQHVCRWGTACAAAELSGRVGLQDKQPANTQAARDRGVQRDADRRRKMTEDRHDPSPRARFDREVAKVGLLRRNAQPALFSAVSRLGQSYFGLIDGDHVVSKSGEKQCIAALALSNRQDRPRGKTIGDRCEKVIGLVAVGKARLRITLVLLLRSHRLDSFRKTRTS
jgi:hypothetical protein